MFYLPCMKRRIRTGKYSGISQIFSPNITGRRGKVTSAPQIAKAFLHLVLVMTRSVSRMVLRSAGERKKAAGERLGDPALRNGTIFCKFRPVSWL